MLPALPPLERIAHAGGLYKERPLTDSIEALNANAFNYILFEMDFQTTSDGVFVCAHSWKEFPNQTAPTYALYRKIRARQGLEDCTIERLIHWLEKHPHARIVTDVKQDNLQALRIIAKKPASVRKRFIPQIYEPEDFSAVQKLGFPDIIWTLYRYYDGPLSVAYKASQMDLYAITVPRKHVWLYAPMMRWIRKRVYTHTVNIESEFNRYRKWGVMEIYTDSLAPNKSN